MGRTRFFKNNRSTTGRMNVAPTRSVPDLEFNTRAKERTCWGLHEVREIVRDIKRYSAL